jgi:hypothetical protein
VTQDRRTQARRYISLFLIFGAIALLAYYLFTNLQKEIAAVIVAGTLSVLSLIITRHLEKRSEIEKDIRQRKTEVYEGLIKYMFKEFFFSKKLGDSRSVDEQKKLVQTLQNIHVDMLIWGSDEVLAQWIKYHRTIAQAGPTVSPWDLLVKSIMPLGDLLLAFRKDIGHNNKDLSNVDIMRMFINDIDDVLMKAIEVTRKDGASRSD